MLTDRRTSNAMEFLFSLETTEGHKILLARDKTFSIRTNGLSTNDCPSSKANGVTFLIALTLALLDDDLKLHSFSRVVYQTISSFFRFSVCMHRHC